MEHLREGSNESLGLLGRTPGGHLRIWDRSCIGNMILRRDQFVTANAEAFLQFQAWLQASTGYTY